jgi:hypothetical protein
MLEVTSDDTPDGHADGHSVLLTRRHRYTGQLSLYRCWTPEPVPLSKLIAIAVTRWRIEEDHQLAKQSTGLDAGQVIRWKSWHRWTAICLLAYIYLSVAAAVQRQQTLFTSGSMWASIVGLIARQLSTTGSKLATMPRLTFCTSGFSGEANTFAVASAARWASRMGLTTRM